MSTAATADRTSLRARHALIALQTALATVLLSAAGLLGLSFYRLVNQPIGFNAEHALAADVMLGAYGDEIKRDQLLRRLAGELGAVPGVSEAAFTSCLPLQGETWIDSISVPGRVVSAAELPHVNVRFVSPRFFAALGIPVLAGRDLAESDRPPGPPPTSAAEAAAEPPGALVLSRAAARLLWADAPLRDLIGRALVLEGQKVVVGIAEDARATLSAPPPAVVYLPYWEQPPFRVSLVARSAISAAALGPSMRAAIWRVAPLAPIPTLRPLTDLEMTAVGPQRYELNLLLLFACLALMLASMGVYALVAHSLARQKRELALRITLGASAPALWRLILREALAPVVGGVAVGLFAAAGAGRLLAAMLFQVAPFSPMVLGPVALAVLVAAGAACVVPTRRAIRADPWTALRAE
jgi:predicted permease